METFEHRFIRIGKIVLAMNYDVHVVLDGEKRTTLGEPSLPGTRPIAQMGLRQNRNLGLQNVPVIFIRWTLGLGKNMAAP